jgi:glycosyltransferase involved in cell wall biosynthesis
MSLSGRNLSEIFKMVKRINELPKISIVMPCFNGAKYIEAAIKSVIEQDYPDFELFIKDGGSSDGTVKIIKKYAGKYPKKIEWISGKDKGQTDAINYGIKKVKGTVIAYLNADDVYKPQAFRTVGKYFLDHPEKIWAVGKCEIIDDNGKQIRGLITAYKNFWLNIYDYNILLILNFIAQMGVFWRKDAIDQIGLFDEKQYYVMDYDYWLRLGKVDSPGLIQSTLACFRIIDSSKSSTGFIDQFDDEYKVAKKYTRNKIILNLHLLHIKMITSIYQTMKLINL